jgi:hypothetical protein
MLTIAPGFTLRALLDNPVGFVEFGPTEKQKGKQIK